MEEVGLMDTAVTTSDDGLIVDEGMKFDLVDPVLGLLSLSCSTGYVVTKYDLGFPEVRTVVYPNSMDDGTYDESQFFGARSVTLDITLKSWSGKRPGEGVFLGSEAVLRDRLLAYLVPSRRPILVFQEEGDNRVRQLQLRGAQAGIPVTRERYNQMTCSWVAPHGVIESHLLTCARFVYPDKPDVGEVIVQNNGNVGAHWRMTLIGDIDDPHIVLGRKELHLQYDSRQGSTVVIDSFTRSITIDGQPIGYKYLSETSEWFLIPPGESKLTVVHKGNVSTRYPWGDWEEGVSTAPTGPLAPPYADVPKDSPGLPGVYPPAANVEPAKTQESTWSEAPWPPPPGPPPWAWANEIDKTTGLPHVALVEICFRSTWV